MAKTEKRGQQREYVGKSGVMNFRITPETRAALVRAAGESGRTLSNETEHRLRRDLFDHGSTRTYAVMRLIGRTIDALVNLKNARATWLDDPYLFQQAKAAVNAAFDLFDPRGRPPATAEESLDLGGRGQGRTAINETLRDILLADPAKPRAKQTARERQLVMLQSDLGDLADQPRAFGKSAAQLREEAKLAAELAPLMRKVRKNPDEITAAENRQFLRIIKRLAELAEGQTKKPEAKS